MTISNNDATTTDFHCLYGIGARSANAIALTMVKRQATSIQLQAGLGISRSAAEKQRGQASTTDDQGWGVYITGSYLARVSPFDCTHATKLCNRAALPTAIMPCCDVDQPRVALIVNLVIFGTLRRKAWWPCHKDTGARWFWAQGPLARLQAGYFAIAPRADREWPVDYGRIRWRVERCGQDEAYDPTTAAALGPARPPRATWGYTYKDGKSHASGYFGGEANKTWPGDHVKTGGERALAGGFYGARKPICCSSATGNPGALGTHTMRKATISYSSFTPGLNPDDGTIKWHFQTRPMIGWDYDGVNELVVLFNYKEGNKEIKLRPPADRNGFFYVLDRTNWQVFRGFPSSTPSPGQKGLTGTAGRF